MSDNRTHIISRQDSKKRSRRDTTVPDKTIDQDSKQDEGRVRSRKFRSCIGNEKKATSQSARIKNTSLPVNREESSDEGSDQDSFSIFDKTSYGARKTNAPGFAIESDEFNGQQSDDDQSGEPNNNLKQHDIEKRMEANRLRAKETRKNKKIMIDEMRSKIFVLTVENQQLKIQNRNQQREIEFLRTIQGHQVSLYYSYSEYLISSHCSQVL